MSVSPSHIEVEIKLRAPDPAAAAELLTTRGFTLARPRIFERNAVFDTPADELRSTGRLLRVRETGDLHTLTFKGPATPGRHKSREELELTLSSGPDFELILDRLGYRRTFIYEKYRTEFEDESCLGIATLDETPIGTFLELEGDSDWIDRVAQRLGFTESEYLTSSYARLYLEWCAQHDRQPANMVWPPEA